MKRSLVCMSLVALAGMISISGFASGSRADDEPAGKVLFLAKKCNLCHGIESQGIAKKSEKMKGEELSNIGSEIPSADWLKGWLLQTELKDGDKHQKKFKGTDEELQTLIDWILTLKTS